jgi:DNA-binding NarL/FixJ family response regulator
VDDYEPWRRFVSSKLQGVPEYQVIGEASDGPEGVRKTEELQPDLILLDVALPSLNGIEVARRIREVSPATRILFVSQNCSVDWATEALGTGAGGYVVKSDASKDLLRGIRAVLEGKRFTSGSLAHHFLQAAMLSVTPTTLPWLITLISGIG